MDTNNWGPAVPKGKSYIEANEPDIEENKHDLGKTDDWRAQLSPISRQRIVNKIMETLKRHLPFSGQEGLQELKKSAVGIEEKIYSAATNQADYLRKISLKMLTTETKSQHTLPKNFPANVIHNSNKPTDPEASHNLVLSLPIQLSANQSQGHQPLPSQNIGNSVVSTGVQSNGTDLQPQLQQQLLGIRLGSLSLQTNQPSVYMLQQSKIPLQSETYGNVGNFLKNQEHLSHPQPLQQQIMSKIQSGPAQLQQQQSSSLLQRLQASAYANGGYWQEEVYQKIKAMKESYYPELNEMYQKLAAQSQQHESLPQQPKTDQLEKVKMFKTLLERMIAFLQVSKSNITPSMKDKLFSYEKKIINFINTNRPRKPIPSLQQGQHPQPHMQPMQQTQSEIPQVQSHESQMTPQLQTMNLQGSVPAMQQNNMSIMQHNPLSSLPGISTSQQMLNAIQPGFNLDLGQGNNLGSLQQMSMGSLQQNAVSAPQQANINAMSSQSGANMLQPNVPLQSNSTILQHQHLKQQQEQQMLHTQQLKQQFQQHLQLQQQELKWQAKQQLPARMRTHQMWPLHQNLLPSLTKTATPLQSANSPFIVPSPSTTLAPSPALGESEKLLCGILSFSNAGNVGHQHTDTVQATGPFLATGTPGISASPLLAEFTEHDKALGLLPQISMGPLQPCPISASQQANINTLSSPGEVNMLRPSFPVQSNFTILQQLHPKQRQEQEALWTPHLQQLFQQGQRQQQVMRLQMLQQQLQQLNRQAKTSVGDQPKIAVQTAASLGIDTTDKSATPLLAEFAGSDITHGSAMATVSGKSSSMMHVIKALLVLFVMLLSVVVALSSLSL